MIAPQVLVICTFLSVMWGIYLLYTINEWQHTRSTKELRIATVPLFRRMIVAICVFMLPFSFLIRTTIVLMGFGDQIGGQIVFFALVGTNVPGSIFCALSVIKPEWFE